MEENGEEVLRFFSGRLKKYSEDIFDNPKWRVYWHDETFNLE